MGDKKVGSVLVVGGGIGGMQSSLDLANSGFKVYMLEEKPVIGGVMSKLDKTFPTNDCAMCMISPKLVECGRHLNIDIITYSDVQGIEGEPGNFKVKIRKKARFVREDKCNGCGDCVSTCPVLLPDEFNGFLSKRTAIYRPYPQAIPNIFTIDKNGVSPCRLACPAGVNAHGYIALISKGEFKKALSLERERNPFAAICGRICHHPCEKECNRGKIDEPVSIASLKRFIADYEFEKQKEKLPDKNEIPAPTKDDKIAIIGGGPAGLTLAQDLSQLGYEPTIFESSSFVGGMLKSAIPKYRLPEEMINFDIDHILDNNNIELKLNTTVGKDITFKEIQKEYKAIAIAVGLQVGKSLPIEGTNLEGVHIGLQFLMDINSGKKPKIGKNVIVIGGGNVAVDVARSVVRMGAEKVQMVCLECLEEMPAHFWEVQEALEEGVILHTSFGPKRILGENGKVTGLETIKVKSVCDSTGRFNPQFYEGTEGVIQADTIIITIGQSSDLKFLPEDIKQRGGVLITDPITFETSIKGVFALGDIANGPASVVQAVASAHEVAISIDRYLKGEDLKKGREKKSVEKAPVPQREIIEKPRVKMPRISLEERKTTFKEFNTGYTEEMAIEEASRCLNCSGCCECFECVKTCKAGAPDHLMEEKYEELEVGAIILSPGFEPFDARLKTEYGYGIYKNVVTSIQFERILSASGPYQGVVQRPSDKKHPEKIAFIQCVGSRDNTCDNNYCSSVCCMYATKEAIVAREHDSKIKPTIFYMDLRAFGKDFDKFYCRAEEEYGVRYIRSMISNVKEDPLTGNLIIKYVDENRNLQEEEFDMVVLSIGLEPSKSAIEMSKKLGIELNHYDFCKTDTFSPLKTSREGIYVCGSFSSPKDIPETVVQGSAAAASVGELLSEVRGTKVLSKQYPEEKDITKEEPRVGVFVCHCGINIGSTVDVNKVVEYAKTIPGVVYAEQNIYTCSQDTQEKIKRLIQEKGLNRVIVASCTPRTHEPLFQETLKEAGLNKFLFDLADIREQCSWVHKEIPEKATEKAQTLIRMSVARSKLLEPLSLKEVNVTKSALIIGGGISGMNAALSIARQGFKVYIIEKENELGGYARNIYYTLEGKDVQEYLKNLIKEVEENELITVYKNTRLKKTEGFVGNFKSVVEQVSSEDSSSVLNNEIEHGVIIVATGGEEYKPDEYMYGKDDRIILQSDLEKQIISDAPQIKYDYKEVVMIQCVGSREKGRNYCSRVCCSEAIKNALKLKEKNPRIQVYILYRDIRTYGFKEDYYKEARSKGIIFIRYDLTNKPQVSVLEDKLRVQVSDPIIKEEIILNPDVVVLSVATRGSRENEDISKKLKITLNEDNFFLEAHVKLRPVDFSSEGIFLCGSAHSPKFIEENIVSALAAASRSMTILSKDHLSVGGVIAVVDPEKCAACLTCVRVCAYDAPFIDKNTNRASIESAKCQGCGTCVSECPGKAIQLQHFKDNQIIAMCENLVKEASCV